LNLSAPVLDFLDRIVLVLALFLEHFLRLLNGRRRAVQPERIIPVGGKQETIVSFTTTRHKRFLPHLVTIVSLNKRRALLFHRINERRIWSVTVPRRGTAVPHIIPSLNLLIFRKSEE